MAKFKNHKNFFRKYWVRLKKKSKLLWTIAKSANGKIINIYIYIYIVYRLMKNQKDLIKVCVYKNLAW